MRRQCRNDEDPFVAARRSGAKRPLWLRLTVWSRGARPPGRLGPRGIKSAAPCGHAQRPASQGRPAADPRNARPEHHRGRQDASDQNHQHGAGRGKVARSGPCCFKHIADHLTVDLHTKAALEMACRRSDQQLRIFTAAPARKAPASALSGQGSQHPAGAGAKYRDQPAPEPDIQRRHDIGRDQQVQPKMRDPQAHPAQPLEVMPVLCLLRRGRRPGVRQEVRRHACSRLTTTGATGEKAMRLLLVEDTPNWPIGPAFPAGRRACGRSRPRCGDRGDGGGRLCLVILDLGCPTNRGWRY